MRGRQSRKDVVAMQEELDNLEAKSMMIQVSVGRGGVCVCMLLLLSTTREQQGEEASTTGPGLQKSTHVSCHAWSPMEALSSLNTHTSVVQGAMRGAQSRQETATMQAELEEIEQQRRTIQVC